MELVLPSAPCGCVRCTTLVSRPAATPSPRLAPTLSGHFSPPTPEPPPFLPARPTDGHREAAGMEKGVGFGVRCGF